VDGWAEMLSMGVSVRPFDGVPPREIGTYSRFDTAWRKTVASLGRELRHLSASRIVLELDITEDQLRLDGMPRAGARLGSQSVRLSFESRHGPLRYETGEYHSWQDNVRAIALSMEALRAVDRYGVSKRGEQYRGWRQLTVNTGNPEDAVVTEEHAREVLARSLNVPINGIRGTEAEVRRALRVTHPDRPGGDEKKFRMVVKAREVLGLG
jgi:hypothetical protein